MKPLPPKPLLELAPWLGAALSEEDFEVVKRHLVVARQEVPVGTWGEAPEPAVGLLILRGRIARNLCVDDVPAHGIEILGEGDLLRPWTFRGETASVPSRVEWTVMATLEVAVLDANYLAAISHWPALATSLLDLSIERTRTLAYFLTARQVSRLEGRVLLTLWHLADRWGRVTPEGVVLTLPKLTHEMIARMVAARRPSVTSGIRRLRELGLVEVQAGGTWVLHGDPIESLHKVANHVDEPAEDLPEQSEPDPLGSASQEG
jgi:CRP-like cAMP-binding protein